MSRSNVKEAENLETNTTCLQSWFRHGFPRCAIGHFVFSTVHRRREKPSKDTWGHLRRHPNCVGFSPTVKPRRVPLICLDLRNGLATVSGRPLPKEDYWQINNETMMNVVITPELVQRERDRANKQNFGAAFGGTQNYRFVLSSIGTRKKMTFLRPRRVVFSFFFFFFIVLTLRINAALCDRKCVVHLRDAHRCTLPKKPNKKEEELNRCRRMVQLVPLAVDFYLLRWSCLRWLNVVPERFASMRHSFNAC